MLEPKRRNRKKKETNMYRNRFHIVLFVLCAIGGASLVVWKERADAAEAQARAQAVARAHVRGMYRYPTAVAPYTMGDLFGQLAH
jgi:hypothetical protein